MSGTVSDTRAIGPPTLSTVDRPTRSSTSVGASGAAAAAAAGAAAATNAGAGCCCACGVATRMTMMATTSAAVVAGLPFVARRKRRSVVVYAEVMVLGPSMKASDVSRSQLTVASSRTGNWKLETNDYLTTSCARLSPRITSTVGIGSGTGTVWVIGPAGTAARVLRRTEDTAFGPVARATPTSAAVFTPGVSGAV